MYENVKHINPHISSDSQCLLLKSVPIEHSDDRPIVVLLFTNCPLDKRENKRVGTASLLELLLSVMDFLIFLKKEEAGDIKGYYLPAQIRRCLISSHYLRRDREQKKPTSKTICPTKTITSVPGKE